MNLRLPTPRTLVVILGYSFAGWFLFTYADAAELPESAPAKTEAALTQAEADRLLAMMEAQRLIIVQSKRVAEKYFQEYQNLKACVEEAAREQKPISTCLGATAM